MRRFWVTGAQGFIGRHLVAHLLQRSPAVEVIGTGRSKAAWKPGELGNRYRYVSVDTNDQKAMRSLMKEFHPDCVFHLAAALHTARPEELRATNVEGTSALLEAVATSPALLVHGSSASVYGEPERLPISEEACCRPLTSYGESKLEAERILRDQGAKNGTRWRIGRLFNVIGPGQSDLHVCGRLVTTLRALRGSVRPVLETGPLDGTRDFIDVHDVARALGAIAWEGEDGEVYNIGSGRETSIATLLQQLIDLSGVRPEVRAQADHPRGVSRQCADIRKVVQLGFQLEWTLERSLKSLAGVVLSARRA